MAAAVERKEVDCIKIIKSLLKVKGCHKIKAEEGDLI